MCQNSALKCQQTCLFTLATVNPSPPRSNTHSIATYCLFISKSNTFLRVH